MFLDELGHTMNSNTLRAESVRNKRVGMELCCLDVDMFLFPFFMVWHPYISLYFRERNLMANWLNEA